MDFENFIVFIIAEYDASHWPPSTPREMFRINESDTVPGILLTALPFGALSLRLETRERIASCIFESVKLTMPTFLVMGIGMRESAPMLSLNGKELRSQFDAGSSDSVDIPQQLRLPQEVSIGNPVALAACAHAITQRREYFANRNLFKEKLPHRPKSVTEQIIELQAAAAGIRRNLHDFRNNIRGDPSYVVTLLRALLYAPNTNASWNPLLRRLANLQSLPLPVFYMQSGGVEPPAGALLSYTNNSISIERRFPGQSLGDLDEFLMQPLIMSRSEQTETQSSALNLIGKLASSASAGHYDETVALILDQARAPEINGTHFLDMLVMDIGRVVADLSDYVASVLLAALPKV